MNVIIITIFLIMSLSTADRIKRQLSPTKVDRILFLVEKRGLRLGPGVYDSLEQMYTKGELSEDIWRRFLRFDTRPSTPAPQKSLFRPIDAATIARIQKIVSKKAFPQGLRLRMAIGNLDFLVEWCKKEGIVLSKAQMERLKGVGIDQKELEKLEKYYRDNEEKIPTGKGFTDHAINKFGTIIKRQIPNGIQNALKRGDLDAFLAWTAGQGIKFGPPELLEFHRMSSKGEMPSETFMIIYQFRRDQIQEMLSKTTTTLRPTTVTTTRRTTTPRTTRTTTTTTTTTSTSTTSTTTTPSPPPATTPTTTTTTPSPPPATTPTTTTTTTTTTTPETPPPPPPTTTTTTTTSTTTFRPTIAPAISDEAIKELLRILRVQISPGIRRSLQNGDVKTFLNYLKGHNIGIDSIQITEIQDLLRSGELTQDQFLEFFDFHLKSSQVINGNGVAGDLEKILARTFPTSVYRNVQNGDVDSLLAWLTREQIPIDSEQMDKINELEKAGRITPTDFRKLFEHHIKSQRRGEPGGGLSDDKILALEHLLFTDIPPDVRPYLQSGNFVQFIKWLDQDELEIDSVAVGEVEKWVREGSVSSQFLKLIDEYYKRTRGNWEVKLSKKGFFMTELIPAFEELVLADKLPEGLKSELKNGNVDLVLDWLAENRVSFTSEAFRHMQDWRDEGGISEDVFDKFKEYHSSNKRSKEGAIKEGGVDETREEAELSMEVIQTLVTALGDSLSDDAILMLQYGQVDAFLEYLRMEGIQIPEKAMLFLRLWEERGKLSPKNLEKFSKYHFSSQAETQQQDLPSFTPSIHRQAGSVAGRVLTELENVMQQAIPKQVLKDLGREDYQSLFEWLEKGGAKLTGRTWSIVTRFNGKGTFTAALSRWYAKYRRNNAQG